MEVKGESEDILGTIFTQMSRQTKKWDSISIAWEGLASNTNSL